MCWTEITWNAPQARWDITRPAGPDYRCDIFEDKVQTAGQVGWIDGQPPLDPRTPAPSTDDEEEDRDESQHSEDTVASGLPGNTTEEEGLAELAESIHINPPMATMTEEIWIIKEPAYVQREITEPINSRTGHQSERVANIVDDEAAM